MVTGVKIIIWIFVGILFLPLLSAIVCSVYYIAIGVFKKGDEGRKFRQGCFGLLFLIGCCVMLGVMCNDNNCKPKPNTFISTTATRSNSHSWSGNHLEKENINDVGWDDTVFICTSGSSKRFHSTLACPGMQNCMNGEDAITREEAEDMGRTHCLRCYY